VKKKRGVRSWGTYSIIMESGGEKKKGKIQVPVGSELQEVSGYDQSQEGGTDAEGE